MDETRFFKLYDSHAALLERVAALEAEVAELRRPFDPPEQVEQVERQWPGPWKESVMRNGTWFRCWRMNNNAVSSRFGSVISPADLDMAYEDWGSIGRPVKTAADRAEADAILARHCDGDDPHPYPEVK